MSIYTVLVLGADGFIGRHIAFSLRNTGWRVLAHARRTARLSRMGFDTLQVDLSRPEASDPEFWHPKLTDVTHVINAAGVLNAPSSVHETVHVSAPAAIYSALPEDTKSVFVSTVGIDGSQTDFATYRLQGEELAKQNSVTVLRVGLVLADTSYGGSSLARSLAALPFCLPVVGDGAQRFNPIHASDLAAVLGDVLIAENMRQNLEIGGTETISHTELQKAYRNWLGLSAVPVLRMPIWLVKCIGKLGDASRLGPISYTAVRQLQAGVLAQTSPEINTARVRPVSSFLNDRPAGTQDLWHARLYLMRPILRLVLAFLWLASGLIGLTLPASAFLPLVEASLPDSVLIAMARLGGICDLLICIALLRNWRPRFMSAVQAGLVLVYTIAFTILAPILWLLPLGGLLKNIPILALIAVAAILEDER